MHFRAERTRAHIMDNADLTPICHDQIGPAIAIHISHNDLTHEGMRKDQAWLKSAVSIAKKHRELAGAGSKLVPARSHDVQIAVAIKIRDGKRAAAGQYTSAAKCAIAVPQQDLKPGDVAIN